MCIRDRKKGCTKAADAAAAIGEGLQAFCIPGSVADDRKVGLGPVSYTHLLMQIIPLIYKNLW